MKKAFFIFFFFLAGTAFAQEFTFRGLPWGASVEDVIAKEGEPDRPPWFRGEYGMIEYYDKKTGGYTATFLSFHFRNNKLSWASYFIKVNPDNISYICADLVNKLSLLYGTPIDEINSQFEIECYWVVKKTKISFKYNLKTSEKTNISISYESPERFEFGGL